MKANELMIGDWICYKGRTQIPARVLSFNYRAVKFDDGTPQDWLSSIENFEPIPLTAEILEKNGFLHSMPNNDWTNDKVDFILVEHGDGYRVQNTSMTLVNVHEFQHALRLCGINNLKLMQTFVMAMRLSFAK